MNEFTIVRAGTDTRNGNVVVPGLPSDELFHKNVLSAIYKQFSCKSIYGYVLFIPGEIDDKIIRKLREILPKIIIKLGIVINIQEHFSPEKTIDLYCKELNNLPLELKNAALHIAYNQLKEENTNKNGI